MATLGGVGRLPVAPGTWGSLAVLPLWWLLRPRGPVAYGLLVLALTLAGLVALGLYFVDPSYQRNDFRGAARLLASRAAPTDALVFEAPYTELAINFYLKTNHARIPMPVGEPIDEVATERKLRADAYGYDRLWLVL
ncbi:MAG: hypothetical protein K6T55_11375 [Syntrophobacterales bacterium]|nr:hypothetical protein [Syntrophobacterales bacterium]